MDHILNVKKVYRQMKRKPIGQRIYSFFHGAEDVLTKKQIREIRAIAEKNHQALLVELAEKEKTAPNKL